MTRHFVLMLFACIVGGGALMWLDRWGDRAAYATAEEYLRHNLQIREVFGPNPELLRTGGSVLGDLVLNWNGTVTGNGVDAMVRVGMKRPNPDVSWRVTRADYRTADGEWRTLLPRELDQSHGNSPDSASGRTSSSPRTGRQPDSARGLK